MNELVKEIDDLLSKYGITIYEAIKIYEKNQRQTKRLTQCYEDGSSESDRSRRRIRDGSV